MPAPFAPRLEILPPSQLQVWRELVDVPPSFTLYGGTAINPQITLKALCYFGDGDLGSLADSVKQLLTQAVAAVELDRLPALGVIRQYDTSRRINR